jgi:hypothetical protein
MIVCGAGFANEIAARLDGKTCRRNHRAPFPQSPVAFPESPGAFSSGIAIGSVLTRRERVRLQACRKLNSPRKATTAQLPEKHNRKGLCNKGTALAGPIR